MRRVLALMFSLVTLVYADIATMPWPKALRDFPSGEHARFETSDYVIAREIPRDRETQMAGGSGGPIVLITLHSKKTGQSFALSPQSGGERLLEDYAGYPQLEIWGRGGGGYWTRCLYRFVSGDYRSVRCDEFEEFPRHKNENATTTHLPFAPRGEGDDRGDTVYFVETRIPEHE